MFDENQKENLSSHNEQAPSINSGQAEDMFSSMDSDLSSSVKFRPQPPMAPQRPVLSGDEGPASPYIQPSPPGAPVFTPPTAPATPERSNNLDFNANDLRSSGQILQKPAANNSVKYLAIGIVTLAVVVFAGWFLYQQVLKPRWQATDLQSEQNSAEITNPSLEEEPTIEELPILPEEPAVENDQTLPVENAEIATPSESAATEPSTPVDVDTDGDGLTDQQESEYGTNPLLIDTDEDGLSDQEEIKVYQTNPLDPDSDGDTYKDGQEITSGYNPNGPGKMMTQ